MPALYSSFLPLLSPAAEVSTGGTIQLKKQDSFYGSVTFIVMLCLYLGPCRGHVCNRFCICSISGLKVWKCNLRRCYSSLRVGEPVLFK
ncbi:Hypothetical predicted protein [Xyrichtys novacula]|uniref:Uncharacterized protein n=1 Tax=Xyrichtys novacula TaxID=13765 RepID=A0AAV1EL97_XYRNO|nr:Hypothetical predicted protein [Xyrichtys novacula]